MSVFNQLIECNKEKKELENFIAKKKAEFEEAIIKETQRLREITLKESMLKEEVILLLEKNNETNVSANSDKLKEIGVSIKEIHKQFKSDIIIQDKKVIMDLIEKYESMEGKLFDGVSEQKTEFLTIRDNN
jgi:acetate kinase